MAKRSVRIETAEEFIIAFDNLDREDKIQLLNDSIGFPITLSPNEEL